MNKLLIVCGPTGAGKTKVALSLAKKFNGELVNADSRQVYKGLDALTGKDRSKEVSIWLYDIVDTDHEFSVAHFVTLARSVIATIQKKGTLPIVVGGTGFYLHALTESIDTISIPPNVALRKKLDTSSVANLQKKLSMVDPMKFDQMNASDRSNPRRLIRAIEVAGKIFPQSTPTYDALWIGLTGQLSVLRQRIYQRVARRWNDALRELRNDLPPILGTRSLLAYTKGEITKEKALHIWADAEFQYAKRQMTWFKKQTDIQWFDVSDKAFESKVEASVSGWYTSE